MLPGKDEQHMQGFFCTRTKKIHTYLPMRRKHRSDTGVPELEQSLLLVPESCLGLDL